MILYSTKLRPQLLNQMPIPTYPCLLSTISVLNPSFEVLKMDIPMTVPERRHVYDGCASTAPAFGGTDGST
ncbi:hypothetical protein BG015_005087, partial [Linnemannia schmuckeri]